MVADVAQVLARSVGEPGERDDRLDRRAELIALRDEPALQQLDLLLEPVDLAELAPFGVAQHRGLERVDPPLEMVHDRVQRVGQAIEHAIEDVVLGLVALRPELVVQDVELRAALPVHGEEVAARDVHVNLDELDAELIRGHARAPVDEQHVIRVTIELGALVELACVLERQLVQAELRPGRHQVGVGGIVEVEPEELVARAQGLDAVAGDLGQDLHRA